MKPCITGALLVVVVGCGGGGAATGTASDPATNPPTGGEPTLVLTTVAIDPPTITVAVNASVQLTATPRDQRGTAMPGLPAATWESSNESVAQVSGTGLVTGRAVGSATITASVTNGSVTRTNSSQVTVTAVAPPVPSSATVTTSGSSFSPTSVTIAAGGTVTWQISGATHNVTFGANKPAGGDIGDTSGGSVSRTFTATGTYSYQCTRHSGMTGQVTVQASGPAGTFTSLSLTPPSTFITPGSTAQLVATALDGAGVTLPGLGPPTYTSTNTAVATVSASGLVTAVANGNVSIIASLAASGVTHADTAAITVGAPAAIVGTSGDQFGPDEVEIAPGRTVVWQFAGTYNVTFEDEAPPEGSIPNSVAGTSAARTFPRAGDYDYYCTLHDGMKGRIRVR